MIGNKAVKKFESHIFHTSPQWEDEESRPLGDIALIQLPTTIEFSGKYSILKFKSYFSYRQLNKDVLYYREYQAYLFT